MRLVFFRPPVLFFALLVAAFLPARLCAQSPEENELWVAARKGDTAKVRTLLENGVNANAKFRYGATALSFACDRGYVEIVRALLERGAEVNIKDTFYGATPLQWALSPATKPPSMKSHNEIVKMLLEKGAEGKDQALLTAVRRPDSDLVRMVLEVGGLKRETLTMALDIAKQASQAEIAAQLAKRLEVKP